MPFTAFLRQNAPFLTAGMLLTFISSFGNTFFISVFSGVIREEFALSHGAWGGIYSVGTMASAAVMVWAGSLTDIFRVRVLGSAVLVFLALACLAMATVTAAWALPFVIFALRLSGQGMSSHIAMVAMARWFVATRGRALAIASLGFAAGEALLPLLFVSLLTAYNWRVLWLFCAIASLAVLPILASLLRKERSPRSEAETSHSTGLNGRHWVRREVLGHWLFWMMVPALLGPAAFVTAFFFQQVHLAEVKGWDHVALVALFPIFTIAGIVSMMASGWAIDRFGTRRLMPLYQLPLAAGFVAMSQAQSLVGAATAMALMAVTSGANSTLPSAFWAEFYGTRNIGAIKSVGVAVMVLGSAIGPGLTGWMIDFGIEFPDQMLGIAVYFGIAATIVGFAMARARHLLPLAA